MRAKDPCSDPPPASGLPGTASQLGRRTAPALAQPSSRFGAHNPDDEVDDQTDDRDPNREAEKKERETDESLENAEHEAEEKKPQHGQRANREYGTKHLCKLQAVAVSTTREARAVFHHDVVVVGGGLIGLACASAIAREGLRVVLVASADQGAASPASAGILAPTVGKATDATRALAITARDLYPGFLEALAERTGLHVPLDRSGILELALRDAEASALRASLRSGSEWIDDTELRRLEPLIAPGVGGVLHHEDGAVDAPALLAALTADVRGDPHISLFDHRVTGIDAAQQPLVAELAGGERVEADYVVVAAGAWVGSIRGLPRPLPVTPVRGQMLAFDGPRMRHVVMGSRGYLVQRGNSSLVGGTMEHAGFDAGTTAEGAGLLQQLAIELSPSFAHRRVRAHWAGLRPMTPDLLPIIGADPDFGRLFYACGHSKNGVLLAPLTARIIGELVARGRTSVDVTPYAPNRSWKIDR